MPGKQVAVAQECDWTGDVAWVMTGPPTPSRRSRVGMCVCVCLKIHICVEKGRKLLRWAQRESCLHLLGKRFLLNAAGGPRRAAHPPSPTVAQSNSKAEAPSPRPEGKAGPHPVALLLGVQHLTLLHLPHGSLQPPLPGTFPPAKVTPSPEP